MASCSAWSRCAISALTRSSEVLELAEVLRDQDGVVRRKAGGPGQQFARGSQAAARQVRQRRRIGLAGGQRFEDGAGGDAPHVGHHGGQLHVGVLEHHLQPVGDASALLDQMRAIAGQVAQLTLLG
jgi:hypothetical protein